MVTDKIGHGYRPFYEQLAEQCTVHTILEVGIAQGEGIELYQEIFPGARIVGVDRYSTAVNPVGPVVVVNQMDPRLAEVVVAEGDIDAYDLIIDDAAHTPGETAATFEQLWPLVTAGGIYVIEDWSHADGIGEPFVRLLPMIMMRSHDIAGVMLVRQGLAMIRKITTLIE